MPTAAELTEQLDALTAELETLDTEADPIAAAARGDEIVAELKSVQDQIKAQNAARERLVAARTAGAEAARFASEPVAPPLFAGKATGTGRAEAGEAEADKFLRRGPFKGLGHLAYAVQHCGDKRPGFLADGVLGEWNAGIKRYDSWIKGLPQSTKAAQGLNELSDSEGAITLPIDIAAGIWERTQGEDNLLTRVGPTVVSGNGIKIKAWNDKSRTGDTLFGGARAYWGAEASQMTKSLPTFRDIDLRLNKLYVLMYATEELLEDAPALESELTRIAGACFVYKINKSLLRGTGTGEPLGLLGHAAKVTQGAVSGQGASTVVAQNIDEMFARRAPGSNSNLIWLYTIDAEAQLNKLAYATGTNSGQLVNMPPTGLAGMPNSSLKGRPMVEMEHCSALGTEGDVILWDPTSHVAIVKGNGINQAASMHLRFDFDETAFKFTFRMDARSRWEAALTPAQSSNTRSPIVTLNSTRT